MVRIILFRAPSAVDAVDPEVMLIVPPPQAGKTKRVVRMILKRVLCLAAGRVNILIKDSTTAEIEKILWLFAHALRALKRPTKERMLLLIIMKKKAGVMIIGGAVFVG